MRKFFLGCLGVAAAAFALQFTQAEISAGLFDQCKPCEEAGECNPCDEVAIDPCAEVACGTKSKFFVNGYAEAGFFANEYGSKNIYGSGARHALTRAGNGPLQNVQNTGGQLNQLYISAGKSVNGRNGWDFGGTVDFTFGTDARLVQANGLEYGTSHDTQGWGTGDYYSAFAQAYFEAEYKKLNIKAGKFFAPFGSNSYKSTDRFFYSLADTYAFVPSTASGIYATYNLNDKLSVYGGWVQPDQFGETSRDNAFLGGVIWQATKRLNLHYAVAAGKNDYIHSAWNDGYDTTDPTEYFVQSLVATYKYKKWTNIFDWSLNNTNDYIDGVGHADFSHHTTYYGINNELIYQINQKWAVGFRAGWHHWSYSENIPLAWSGSSNYDKATFSIGANWTPTKWLLIKPELRYDTYGTYNYSGNGYGNSTSSSNSVGAFGKDRDKDHQLSGGLSAIVKF